MITCKGWCITFAFAAALACNADSAAKIELQLSAKQITPGERAKLEVRFQADGDFKNSTPQISDALLTNHPNLKILGQSERAENGAYIWTYEITAYAPGELRIPPLEVQWQAVSLSTEATPLSVQSARSETDFEMRPDAPALALPLRWTWIFLGVLAFLASGTLVYLYSKLKRKPRPSPTAEPAALTEEDPKEWVRKELLAFRSRWTQNPNPQQLTELHQLLRRYLTRRIGKPVESWTPTELRRRGARSPDVQNLVPIIEDYDEARFRPDQHDLSELVGPFLDRSEKTLS